MFDIASQRLHNLNVSTSAAKSVGELVAALGAIQAQDYPGALWAIGLRLPGSTVNTIEQAITGKQIVRTWPMRGTLHFVAAADIRWIINLLGPRAIKGRAGRRKNLELDEATIDKSRELITAALAGGKVMTRGQLCQLLDESGISPAGQRGIHILSHLCLEGLLCFGPHDAKQPTFVLIDDWLPPGADFDGEAAVAELARRYFASHGPAQIQDLVWWSGMRVSEARQAVAAIRGLAKETVNGKDYFFVPQTADASSPSAFLLPGFDEYLLGYRDRTDVLHELHSDRIVPGGNGMFLATVVINGQVVGTWSKAVKKNEVIISLKPFGKLTKADLKSIEPAVRRYGEFLGLAARLN